MALWQSVRDSTFTLLRDGDEIGRHPSNDLVLIGRRASRRHAVVQFDGEQWTITDRSENGTFVGGVRAGASPVPLGVGATVQFGDGEDRFVVTAVERPAPVLFDATTGERRSLLDGPLHPDVSFDLDSNQWVVDGRPAAHGAALGGFTFHLPREHAASTTQAPAMDLLRSTVTLRRTARDRYSITIEQGHHRRDFSDLAWIDPLFWLARARAAAPDDPDGGWVDIDDLSRDSLLYRKQLDTYLGRARRFLVREGIVNGDRIVLTQLRARRLGVVAVVVEE